jgi:L-fucose isomerase-like protein
MRPLEAVKSVEEAARLGQGDHDAVIVYAAGGNVRMLEALTAPRISNLMFLRHRSGPVYLWYEIAHPRMLRKTDDAFEQPGMGIEDVVVDDTAELGWKLRAAYGLKNTWGKKIVAVGGPSGWGRGGRKAPEISRDRWKLDIRTVTYEDLAARIRQARTDDERVKRCSAEAERYMSLKGVSVETSRDFVRRAFLLTDVLRDLLDEAQTDAITINQCMGTIMGISETTACLPLSLLNDEGYMAFCESDFVVIPSGILLRYIASKPVFLNDPTHPHHGVVTLAHCTAPRKMDGVNAEPVRVLTHFESDYGAAPKVEMRKGQRVTNLIPDFANKRWVGFEGDVVAVPFMAICRSQIDVSIPGDTQKLLETMGGFHWMTSYGAHLREAEYALKKADIDLVRV